jgi:hypothetical protein
LGHVTDTSAPIIRIRRGRTLIQQEYRTFAQRSAAARWAKHREVQLENQAVPGRKQHEPVTLAALIRWYIETFETISKWPRSKQSHLEFLERHAIGKENALELTAAALIGHVRRRRADGAATSGDHPPGTDGQRRYWSDRLGAGCEASAAQGRQPPPLQVHLRGLGNRRTTAAQVRVHLPL